MWHKVGPALKASSKTLFAPSADLVNLYRAGLTEFKMDWTLELPPAPPQPWYRRLRRRALDGAWRIIEAL